MAELPRPGIEILQTFASQSPSFVRPTLVPCVVGAAYEIINVLNSDATINSKAKYGAYAQIGSTITQSAFPDPRSNVDEQDIIESAIRPYLLSAGKLSQLLLEPGESFLTTSHNSSKAAIETVAFAGGTGLALNGKVLVLAIDQPVPADATKDVTITFVGTGNLTSAQAVAQINAAAGQTVATVSGTSPSDKVRITSPRAGAKSSVTVRAGGSANSVLQIGFSGGSAAHEERIVGSGYRGQDDNNNNTTTPWIEFYRGAYLLDGVDTTFTANTGLVNIETGSMVNSKAAAITFGDTGTIPLHAGDFMFADGLKPKDAEVMRVEGDRFRLGTINTALSVADDTGHYTTKVYDAVEVETLFDDNPFAPQYVYFKATGLVVKNLAPVAATLTGTTTGAAATAAIVTTGVITTPVALAGLKLHYVSTINGVATEGNFVFTGGPFATVAALVTAIGTNIPGVTATDAGGGLLRFTSTSTGRLQGITLKADGTANASLNLSTSSDTAATGKDVEFIDIPPRLVGTNQTFAFSYTTGQTLVVESSNDGGVTWAALTRTFTFPATTTTPNIAGLVAVLNTGTSWNGGTLPTNFVIASSGNAVTITGTVGGQPQGLRIGAASTAIGVTAGSQLGFTSLQTDIGEEELNGQILKLKFDKNPHLYQVSFSANSLDLAIADINAAVGATVASKTGAGSDQLKLVSPLKGSASEVLVLASAAATAFGLSLSAAAGSARPYPDSYLDSVNNLVIGSQILRDQVTGYPLDQTTNFADLYIQYKGLRKDVSALAKVAGVLRIPDQDTLLSVLDPLTEDNPLGFGLFMCLINAPGLEVKGLGVDEISGAAPEGTESAYARAAGFLEAEEVYAMAPLTQNEVVHGIFASHVLAMSQPEQGGERIVFINKVMPERKNPTVAASSTKANSTSTTNQMLLDVNPAGGLVSAGLNPALPFVVDDGVYIEFEVDGQLRRYNIANVSGTLANLNVTFTSSQNVDGFYTTTPLTETVLNAAWSLKVLGDSLIVPGSNPARLDYSLVSETVADANAGFHNRRLFSVFPETIKTTINGIEKALPGYYACAAITGMCASQPPQQGFTNFPITGLTGVQGTEKFSKKQLNVMAGGGTYVLIQDVIGGPVSSRHQLSTDLTSIETRELSITKVVDFTAKFLRQAIRKFIGVQVINDGFLDTVGTTIQGILNFLVVTGVLNGAELNNIIQDEDQPDTVLVDITLDVPFPANYIRLTLVV